MITYQCAYLKAHYPLEFMAAVLSSVLNDTDRLVDRLEECRQSGYKILPPDISKSSPSFKREGEKGIRFALAAVKGVGLKAARMIVAEAKKRPFAGIFDFCERVDLHTINRGTIEALICAGAMDSFPGNRAQKIKVLDDAIRSGQQQQSFREMGQGGLFDDLMSSPDAGTLPGVDEFPEEELLMRECSALGFFLTNHPVNRYSYLEKYSTCKVKDVRMSFEGDEHSEGNHENDVLYETGEQPKDEDCKGEDSKKLNDGDTVIILGRITSVSNKTTRDGKRMAVMNIEDATGVSSGVIFPETLLRLGHYFSDMPTDQIFLVIGSADFSRDSAQIIVDDLVPPAEALSKLTSSVNVKIDIQGDKITNPISKLRHLIEEFGRGPVKLRLIIKTPKKHIEFALADNFAVKFTDAAYKKLQKAFGANSVVIVRRSKFGHNSRRRNGSNRFRNNRSR